MHRVLVPIDSYTSDSWNYAIAYALKITETSDTSANIVILVHTKNQIKSTSLESHIGASNAKSLGSGKSLNIQSRKVSLETLRTVGRFLNNTVLIAFYADEKLLSAVDDIEGLLGVVAVPDMQGDADQWVTRWDARIHGQPTDATVNLISDPVVEAALMSIFNSVNASTGIGNTRDKELANEVFRILKAKGHVLKPIAIRSRAIQEGWKSKHANDLSVLAEKIMSLKSKPKLSSFQNVEKRYANWAS